MHRFHFLRTVTAAALAPLAALSPAVAGDQEIDPSKFKRTFSDEFDGDQLDTTKWQAPEMPRQGSCRRVKSLVNLGSDEENAALNYLSPHTTRKGRYWETAPRELASLREKFHKPIVDDEPARNGTS
jgi:hypothetical protein